MHSVHYFCCSWIFYYLNKIKGMMLIHLIQAIKILVESKIVSCLGDLTSLPVIKRSVIRLVLNTNTIWDEFALGLQLVESLASELGETVVLWHIDLKKEMPTNFITSSKSGVHGHCFSNSLPSVVLETWTWSVWRPRCSGPCWRP